MVHYIQSEKVRGLQPAIMRGDIDIYYIQSEKVRGLQRSSTFCLFRQNYIRSEKVRGLQQLRVNELDAHQSSFSAFLPS